MRQHFPKLKSFGENVKVELDCLIMPQKEI